MITHTILRIDAAEYPIVSGSVTLELDAPGRAVFAVKSAKTLTGKVTFLAGINGQVSPYFSGYVASCVKIDAHQVRIFCRESWAKLADRAPISRRNSKIADILADLAKLTGIEFTCQKRLQDISVSHFFNLQSGFDAVAEIKKLSGEADFVMLGQPSGKLFLGSLAKTQIYQPILRLSCELFTNVTSTSADCAFLPVLRPGMRLRIDDGPVLLLTAVNLAAEKLHLNFEEL